MRLKLYLSRTCTDDFHSYVARVDHTFSERQRMFVRFVNNRRDQFAFGGNNRVGLGTDQQGPLVRENYGVVIDSTTTISPTAILSARFGFSRFLQAAFREARRRSTQLQSVHRRPSRGARSL